MRPLRWACLMYHEIPADGDNAGYFGLPKKRFEKQLDAVSRAGRTAASLEQLLFQPAGQQVALTFDDGHHTQYRHAFPLLAARHISATFFVTTDWVGSAGYVTWDELREMSASGMSIQSHSRSHPFLSELDETSVEHELVTSKAIIENEIGKACTTLALPNGDAPRRFPPTEYARLGYTAVATSKWGPNRTGASAGSTMFVRRYTVRRDINHRVFQKMSEASVPTYSSEGLRLETLSKVRALMGPSRYSRLRTRILRALSR